ncbi:hypothetical protein RclHR1_05050001 [Rhizophagus clarus]|uniref:Uncharacterized protein n=1 Tax=Rhizophagus clarus TaxID=94130 RepID=A0A2Z6RKK2_9GLOM|nr:hypothetical protein RclHR1_05050001 [Rhizophagus clarus]
MRLLVAEKLYSLCSTTEYRDMPINEINKCIDKFHKKNPSFPKTVGDWAEREMICRHVNYRRSIINNTRNVVKRKRVVCNEIKSNEVDVVIEEDYNDEESQHSEIEKHSKRKSKTRKILNDTSLATKYHSLQSDNNYEDVETSGQECEAIETDNNVSSAEKCPTSKPQSEMMMKQLLKSLIKNPKILVRSASSLNLKPAKQPNNHDNKGVSVKNLKQKKLLKILLQQQSTLVVDLRQNNQIMIM